MSRVLVWHRGDLRVPDNPAVAAAARDGDPVPVFVLDPAFLDDGLACPDRVRFCFECLRDLREQYRERGSDLALLHGDPRQRLPAVARRLDAPVYYNRETTARYGRERDAALADRDRFRGFDADAVRREAADPRDGWADHAEAYMTADPVTAPDSLPATPLADDCSLDAAVDRYDLRREKARVPKGGRSAALARLDRFLDTIRAYPGNISAPAAAEEHCSRLSPYLAFGALSVREAHRRAMADAPDCAGREFFLERLYWNQHFTQKLADDPLLTERATNPVFRGLHRDHRDPDLVDAWKHGETGFPLVDAAMRALVETGYVNFRMRALAASFYVYVLREWWKEGADFMYRHLIDADPAINYAQWQMQAGTVGVHPNRIYDPAKGVRDHDPDGAYVRRYVPELRPLPDEHLPRPERTPVAVQQEVGVTVGEDYPYPVVDFDHRRRQARERRSRLADRAREAMADPAVRRRASLSRRYEDVEADDGGGQASLDEFG